MTRYIVVTTLLFFISIGTLFAQVTKPIGTRITDSTEDKTLSTSAILDLDSSTKGFYMPRMNDAQKIELERKLVAEGINNTGLVIYNTDNDCIEYWHSSTQKWRSLCGSLPPAEIVINGTCDQITFGGFANVADPELQQGVALTTQTISVPIKVNKIGTYSASVTTDNGYFFSGEGQFQAVGNYTIILKGNGTPVRGYDGVGGKTGDVLSFSFNGVESKVCTTKQIKVKPADMVLTINQNAYKVEGKYYVNESAAGIVGNKLTIKISVTIGGEATIIAYNAMLGMKFSGTKKVTAGADQDFELLPVVGEASAKENIAASYPLTFGVNVKNENEVISGRGATMVVEETSVSFNPADVILGNEAFYRDTPLNDKHSIIVPVIVEGSGKTTLHLKDGSGRIDFIAKDVVLNRVKGGAKQNVTFIPVTPVSPAAYPTMPATTTLPLKLTGEQTRFKVNGANDVVVPLGLKPVAYTIDCNNIKPNKSTMVHNRPVGKDYYIIVPVNVTVVGEYEIYTIGDADGVTFSSNEGTKKLSFSKTGVQNVMLYATDPAATPTIRATYEITIATRDGSNNANCGTKFKARVGFNDIKVLLYEANTNNPNRPKPLFGAFFRGIIGGKPNFGPEGELVKTGDVIPTSFEYNNATTNTAITRKALSDKIKNGDFNLIIMEGMTVLKSLDQDLYDAFLGYIQKGGAIFISMPSDIPIQIGKPFVAGLIQSAGSKLDGPVKTTLGIDLITALNDNKELLSGYTTSDPRGIIINTADPILVGPTPLRNYYFITNGNGCGAVTTGTKFEALVSLAAGNKDAAVVFRHVDYRYLFIDATVPPSTMFSFDYGFNATGAIIKNGNNPISVNTNILVNMIQKVAND